MNTEQIENLALTCLSLLVKVDPDLNVFLIACITMLLGCYRFVKPISSSKTMSNITFFQWINKGKKGTLSMIKKN